MASEPKPKVRHPECVFVGGRLHGHRRRVRMGCAFIKTLDVEVKTSKRAYFQNSREQLPVRITQRPQVYRAVWMEIDPENKLRIFVHADLLDEEIPQLLVSLIPRIS